MTSPRALATRSLALGAGLVFLASACGDDSTDSVIEEVIEQRVGGDGSVSIEGEDSEISVNQGSELPSEWPVDVVKPDGLAIDSSSMLAVDQEFAIAVFGTARTDPSEFIDSYSAALISSGFEQTANFEGEHSATRSLSNGTWTVLVGMVDDGFNEAIVTVSVRPET